MTKKTLTPTLISVLLVALGVAAACGKDAPIAEPATATSHNYPHATKVDISFTEDMITREVMRLWYKCDSAYRADSTTFINLCNRGNLVNLMSAINYRLDYAQKMKGLVQDIYLDSSYTIDTPSYHDTTCYRCMYSNLKELGTTIIAVRDTLNAMIESGMDSNFFPNIKKTSDPCYIHCYIMNDFQGDAWLQSICMLNCRFYQWFHRRDDQQCAVTLYNWDWLYMQ